MIEYRTSGSRVRIENTVDAMDGEVIVYIEIGLSNLDGKAPFPVNGNGYISVTLLVKKQTVVSGECTKLGVISNGGEMLIRERHIESVVEKEG